MTPSGVLRRHGTAYAGTLDIGPAQYVIEGIPRGRDAIACEFRWKGRKVAEGEFVRNATLLNRWACEVTILGFPWLLGGFTPCPGEMTIEGVAAPKEDNGTLDGLLPF